MGWTAKRRIGPAGVISRQCAYWADCDSPSLQIGGGTTSSSMGNRLAITNWSRCRKA